MDKKNSFTFEINHSRENLPDHSKNSFVDHSKGGEQSFYSDKNEKFVSSDTFTGKFVNRAIRSFKIKDRYSPVRGYSVIP